MLGENNEVQLVELTGNSFSDLGRDYVDQLEEALFQQLNSAKSRFTPINPSEKENFDKQVNKIICLAPSIYPPELIDFFKGAEQASSLMKFNDFVYLDQLLSISKLLRMIDKPAGTSEACSFVSIVKNDVGVVGGRNFDWDDRYNAFFSQHNYCLTMSLTGDDSKQKIAMIGWLGMVNCPTIMNGRGLYYSFNSATECTDNKLDLTRPYYPAFGLLAMMKCTEFSELHDWAQSAVPGYGFNVTLAGPKGQMVCVESSPFNIESKVDPDIPDYKNQSRFPTETKILHPELSNPGVLASTNLFERDDWERYLGYPIPENTPGFSTDRMRNLFDLAKQCLSSGSPSLKQLQGIMERSLNTLERAGGATKYYPSTNKFDSSQVTYHTVAFDTQKRSLSARVQRQGAPNAPGQFGEWKKFKPF